MTVEFDELTRGHEYVHRTQGKSTFIASHPHDGAYLIMEGYNSDEDEHFFFACVREDLELA